VEPVVNLVAVDDLPTTTFLPPAVGVRFWKQSLDQCPVGIGRVRE
jgi:hypothetical protein